MKRIVYILGFFGSLCALGGSWQSVDGVWDGYFSDPLHWNGGFASDGGENAIDAQYSADGLIVTVKEATNVTGKIIFDGRPDRPAILDVRGSSLCFATQTVDATTWPANALYGRFNTYSFFKHNSNDARWNKMAQAKLTDVAVQMGSPEPGVAEMRVTGGTVGGVFDFVHPDSRGDTMAPNTARPTVSLFEADYYQPARSTYNHARLSFVDTVAYLPSVGVSSLPPVAEIALSNSTLRAYGNLSFYPATNIVTLSARSMFALESGSGGWCPLGGSSGLTVFRMDDGSSLHSSSFPVPNNLHVVVDGGSLYPTTEGMCTLSGHGVLDLRRVAVSRDLSSKFDLSGNARLRATDCALTNATKFTVKTADDAKVELVGGTLSTPLMAGADGARIDLTNVAVSVQNWGLSKGRVAMTDCTLAPDSVFVFSGMDGLYALTNVTGATSTAYPMYIAGTNVVTFAADSPEKKLVVNSSEHSKLGDKEQTHAELNVVGGTLEFRSGGAYSRFNLAHGYSSVVAVLNVSGGRLVSKVALDGTTRNFGLGITHGTGFINVSGGEVDVSGLCICTEESGNANESRFRQTGGLVKVEPGAYQASCQSYGLCATGNNKTKRKARIALDGGVTEVNVIAGGTSGKCRGGTGWTAFEANGGTVKVNGDNAQIVRDFDEATLGEKGLRIDANGYAVSIAQNLASQPGATGRLFVTGAGTTTIVGTNAVDVVVDGGTVAFAATADNTDVNLIATNGAAVACAAGGAKNRTFASLVLGDAVEPAVLTLTAGEPLTVAGEVSIARLAIVFSGVFTTGQDYALLTCGGTISDASKAAWRKALASGLAADQGCDLVFEEDAQGRTVLKASVRAKKTLAFSVDAHATSNVTEDVVFAVTDTLAADVGAEGTLNVTGSASQGALVKTGAGRAIFDGAANFFAGGVTVESGLVSFPHAENFADAALNASPLIVGKGTLALGRAGAAPVTLAAPLRINTAAARDAAVVKADSDVALAAPTVTKGCLVKRGTGTLALTASGAYAFSSNAGADVKDTQPHAIALAFDDYGTPPTDNYSALTVAEGDLVLKGTDGATYTTSGSAAVYVGMPVLNVAEPARLVVDGVAAQFNGAHFHVGSGVKSANCSQPNAQLVVTNGAAVSVTSLRLGWGADAAAHPSVRVGGADSALYFSEYLYLSDSATTAASEEDPNLLVTDGASLLLPTWSDANVNHALVLRNTGSVGVFDNALLADVDLKQARLRCESNSSGTLVFRNGAECRLGEVRAVENTSKAELIVNLVFDDAAWSFGELTELELTHPERVKVTARGKGLAFAPGAGTNLTFGLAVSGSGDLVQRGAGSLTLDAAPTLTGVCRVEAGSLALADGVAATNLTLAGAGSLTSGTFAQATLVAPLGDAGAVTGAVPVLAGAAFTGRTCVDLARTSPLALPYPTNVRVTTYTGSAPDVSGWKVVHTGTSHVRGKFTAVDGEIRMDIESSGVVVLFR